VRLGALELLSLFGRRATVILRLGKRLALACRGKSCRICIGLGARGRVAFLCRGDACRVRVGFGTLELFAFFGCRAPIVLRLRERLALARRGEPCSICLGLRTRGCIPLLCRGDACRIGVGFGTLELLAFFGCCATVILRLGKRLALSRRGQPCRLRVGL